VKRQPSVFVFFLRTCPRTSNTSTKSMRKRVSHKHQQEHNTQHSNKTRRERKQTSPITHACPRIHAASPSGCAASSALTTETGALNEHAL
jgi:hypothetical protein